MSLAPTRLVAGRYRVEEALGRGGMGEVHLVHDVRTDRPMALKRARRRRSGAALLEREFHTLTQLAHPRIIEVYDYGVDDDGPFYTMELLDGADLRSRGRLPWREACAVLRDVASSLAILHSRRLLHRDVSARNVRCTADGRAKLIDFGAMMPMGAARDLVGTPPFVAPEALQMQALDARSDLFSLGALAYYVLTGRHAYPARTFVDVRDAWRSPPIAPERRVPEIPEALGRLVLRLLSLDRSARPRSAAEVMEQLCAIAELPVEERVEVTRAYLSTPSLVGRDNELLEVRRLAVALARGYGSVIVVEGSPGSGRSRFLDACVLEGKLLGATVLRADAGDGAAQWGVAGALASQLLEAHPEVATESALLSGDLLGHVVPALQLDEQPLMSNPSRGELIRGLRDWVLTVSARRKLFIAVDDVDAIDDASAAWLAALAYRVEPHALTLVCTRATGRDAPITPSLSLLSELAVTTTLSPLSVEDTEALLRSVFGDAAHLTAIALRVHALSQGNPRALMELLEHMVQRGLATYEAGSWTLPAELTAAALPESTSAALSGRLARLSATARSLAEALAITQEDGLSLEDYPLLDADQDHGRLFRALDELVATGVLNTDGDGYRFSHAGLRTTLEEELTPARARELHARVAERFPRLPLLQRARHLLRGGEEQQALALIAPLDLAQDRLPLSLLEEAYAAAERLGCSRRMRHDLASGILLEAPMSTSLEPFHRHLPEVLAQLELDSGLADYWALEGQVPDGERLTKALERAQARHEAASENDRGLGLVDAIRGLAQLMGNLCSIAMQVYDLEMLDALPTLDPLLPLSPALGVVQRLAEASREALRGRTTAACAEYESVLERLQEPDQGGLQGAYYEGVYHALHYLLGLVEASMGMESAEEHAAILEQDANHRVNGWRVRVAFHLNQGNAEQARRAQRRAELLQIQEAKPQRYLGTSAGFELLANAMAGDLLGVKHATDALAPMAERHRGWRPALHLGKSYYRALSGDLEGALEALEPALELAPAGRHPYFAYAAAAHVSFLGELGRHQEALAHARTYVEMCERERVDNLDRWVLRAAAEALGRAGELEAARDLIERTIAAAEERGLGGLSLGALYETRARIAIWCDDDGAFAHYASRCAAEYKKGNNAALAMKFARLMDEANAGDVSASEPPPDINDLIEMSQTGTAVETLQSLMLECLDDRERARAALTHLLRHADSNSGHLFAADGGLSLLASVPAARVEDGMRRWLEARLEEEMDEATATETVEGEQDPLAESIDNHYTTADGRCYEAMFLSARFGRSERIVAAVALSFATGPRNVPSRELLRTVAEQLLMHGGMKGFAAV